MSIDSAIGKHRCGFCNGDSDHSKCPGAVKNGKNAPVLVVICPCTEDGCGAQKLRCLDCNTTVIDYIDGERWRCIDTAECELRQQQFLDNDPLVQSIRKVKETAMAETKQNTTPREKAAPKVGKCLVTGKATKGGKFAPGQDAKYVSLKVASVLEGKAKEKEVLAEMKGHDLSDALQGKFTKSLGLARDRVAKQEAAAKAKAEADKAAAKEKAAVKA